MTERKADLKFGVDGTAVKTGLAEIKRDVGGMAADVKRSAKEAADGLKVIGDQAPAVKEKIKGIGDQAPEMARKMEAATRSMANSLQREIALLEAGSKSSREYRESLIKMRGGDLAALKPLLDQLDAAKAKSEAAARAHKQLGDSAAVAGRDHDQLAKRINVLGTAADFARGQLLALASGLSLGALAAWVQHINDGVDALNDIKDATGASIENISALEDVGRRTGASFETVGSILVKFNDVLSKATPKSDIANALKAIGLEAEALKKLDPAEALRVTAVALSSYADDANKARLVQDLFGKSVKEAAPFLADLAEKGELVAKRTQAQADAADAFNKKIFDLKATSNDLSRDLVDKMLPGLTQIIDAMGKGAKEGGALLAVWRGIREFGSIAFGTDKLGTAMSDAKAQAAELKRLNNVLIGAQTAADADPDNERAQRRVANLRKQIEDTMKAAQAASEKVKELVNGPTPAAAPTPPEPPKPSIKPPKTAAEIAAAEAAAKKAADERKKALEDEAKLLAELSGLSGSFAKEWEILNKAFTDGKLNTEQLQAAQAKLLEKQPFMQALRKQEAEDLKTATEAAKQRIDAYNKEVDGIEKWIEAQDQLSSQTAKGIQDRITAMDDEEEATELATRQNISLAEAINRVRVARLQEKRDGPTGAYEGSDEWNRITREINALDTEADRINAKDRRDKTRDDNKRAKEEIDRWVEDTGRGLGDAVETGIRSGSKAGGKALRETLQEQLIRKPLRVLLDGVMNQVTGGFLQMLGIGGGGAGGAAGGGGLGSLFSLASNASSLYNGASALGSVFSGATGLGTFASFSGGASGAILPASMVGPSIQAPTIMSNLGYMSSIGSGATTAASSAAGGAAAGAGGAGAGAGSLAGGGVFGLIAALVINALGGMRSESMIGSGLAGTLGNGSKLTPWQEWREGGTLFYGADFATHNPLEELELRRKQLQEARDSGQGETNYGAGLQAIVTDLEKTTKGLATQTAVWDREINKGYRLYRDNVVQMANSIGLAGDTVEDWAYELGAQDLNFQGLNPEQIQAKITETFGKAGDEMTKQFLGSWKEVTDTIVNTWVNTTDPQNPVWTTETTTNTRMEYQASVYAKTGETAIQTLERLSKSFNTLNETSDALGFGIHKGSLALADFSDKFIEAFGGLERFSSTTSAYMQAYYSDDERKDALLRSGARQANRLFGADVVTAESLEQMGKDGIRAFVTGLTTSGATAEEIRDAMDIANMLAPAWASMDAQTPVVDNLSNAVDELTQSYQNAVKSLTSDRDSLAVEVLRAQGDEKGAKALERTQYMAQFAGLDEVRRKEIETLYDGNMATRAYIEGIKAAAQAQLDALDKLRADSIAQIDTAAGKTDAAMAAYERAADKERERLQGVIDTTRAVFQAAEEGAKSFFSRVDDVAKFQAQEGREFITQALASVRAGGALPDGQKLSDAIAAVGQGFETTQYATQADADFQRLVVANELKGLKEASGDQLSAAEGQLKALNEQVEWARNQVSLLRGIDSSLKDLPAAIAKLIEAYNIEAQTRANVGTKAIIGTGSGIYDKTTGTGKTAQGAFFDVSDMAEVARDAIAANGAAGRASVLDSLEGKGFTMSQYNEMFGLPQGTLEAEAKALGRPVYHSGTPYVPETGYALLQKGEMVIPTAYNPNAHGRVGAGQEVMQVLQVVVAEQGQMREQFAQFLRQLTRTADAVNGRPEAPMLVENV